MLLTALMLDIGGAISDEEVGPLYILPNEIDMNVAVYEEKNMIPYFKGHTNPFILQ